MSSHKSDCHKRLMRMFRENTTTPEFPLGRTTTKPRVRELTPRELAGFQRSRVRRIEFMPGDLR